MAARREEVCDDEAKIVPYGLLNAQQALLLETKTVFLHRKAQQRPAFRMVSFDPWDQKHVGENHKISIVLKQANQPDKSGPENGQRVVEATTTRSLAELKLKKQTTKPKQIPNWSDKPMIMESERSSSPTLSPDSNHRLAGMALVLLVSFGLSGCTTPMSRETGRSALSEALLQRQVSRQAEKDPFPTSQEAGIR